MRNRSHWRSPEVVAARGRLIERLIPIGLLAGFTLLLLPLVVFVLRALFG